MHNKTNRRTRQRVGEYMHACIAHYAVALLTSTNAKLIMFVACHITINVSDEIFMYLYI